MDIKELREWKDSPVTQLIMKEIIELRLNVSENVYNAVRQKDLDGAMQYIGMRDAYSIVLGIADEKLEDMQNEV